MLVLAVGTQHAASASGMTEQQCQKNILLGLSSGGRSMLRPYSERQPILMPLLQRGVSFLL